MVEDCWSRYRADLVGERKFRLHLHFRRDGRGLKMGLGVDGSMLGILRRRGTIDVSCAIEGRD